jgi:nitroreductase
MLSRDTTLQILRDGCRAPSGDNCQPWRFRVAGNVISVLNVPDKDTSLFNYRQGSNYVALGASIENIRISGESRGFQVKTTLFPNPTNHFVVSSITLTSDPNSTNEFAPYIGKRATNRKKYHTRQIAVNDLTALATLADTIGGRVAFVDDREQIAKIAHTVSLGEKLALEDRSIHDFLFEHVTWTKEEDRHKHGFLIDTFEFSPPQKAAFKIFSHWNILRYFLPLGVSRMIAKDMEATHQTAAAFGAIIMFGKSDEDYLKTGMLLERLWLAATRLGLALQPTTTVHFIGTRVLENDSGSLSPEHQTLLKAEYAELAKLFRLTPTESLGFVFRLGYADAPSAQTTRFEPEVSFED